MAIVGMLFVFGVIVCFLGCVGIGLYHRTRMRELAHRERMAMIEKGLDPSRADVYQHSMGCSCSSCGGVAVSSRHRMAGTTLIGLGFALMVLITFAGGAPGAGIGVGGALVVLGFTFFLASLLGSRQTDPGRNKTSRSGTDVEVPSQGAGPPTSDRTG